MDPIVTYSTTLSYKKSFLYARRPPNFLISAQICFEEILVCNIPKFGYGRRIFRVLFQKIVENRFFCVYPCLYKAFFILAPVSLIQFFTALVDRFAQT